MWNSIVSVPDICPFIYLTLAYQHYAYGINGTGLNLTSLVQELSPDELYVDFTFSKYVQHFASYQINTLEHKLSN